MDGPLDKVDGSIGKGASGQPIRMTAPMSVFHPLQTLRRAAKVTLMAVIDADLLSQLPLTDVAKVTFYKRDELTTDLICCDVLIGDRVWKFHEELVGWDLLIDYLQGLPSFRGDWFAAVSQPPFATSETVAFSRR